MLRDAGQAVELGLGAQTDRGIVVLEPAVPEPRDAGLGIDRGHPLPANRRTV